MLNECCASKKGSNLISVAQPTAGTILSCQFESAKPILISTAALATWIYVQVCIETKDSFIPRSNTSNSHLSVKADTLNHQISSDDLGATTKLLIATSPNSSEKFRRPPIFGDSILDLDEQQSENGELTASPPTQDDRAECPVCLKYSKVSYNSEISKPSIYDLQEFIFLFHASQGPCGEIFQNWLKCTDEYANLTDHTTGEELHLTKCSHLALPLAECLDLNEEYYKSQGSLDNDSADQEYKYLIRQWCTIIEDLESERKHKFHNFPSEGTMPKMEANPQGDMGLAVFCPVMELVEKNITEKAELILAYVKDDKGKLIAAATSSDMRKHQDFFDGLPLSFDIDNSVKFLTSHAVYNTEKGTLPPIYSKRFMIRR